MNIFQPFDFFILRSPAKSLSHLQLLNSFPFDQVVKEIDEIFRNFDEQESIYLASPELYRELIKWLDIPIDDKNKLDHSLIQTLYKYIIRKRFRCTPYGNFAGVALGHTTEEETILLLDKYNYHSKKHTRLDMNYVCEIYSFLLNKIPELKKILNYTVNSTLYEFDGSYRYYEYKLKNKTRQYFLVSVKGNKYLRYVIEQAQKSISHKTLLLGLVTLGLTKVEADSFVNTLIQSQLIVSDFEPTITGPEYFDYFLEKLKDLGYFEEYDILKEIKSNLDSSSESLDRYEKISSLISKHFIETSTKDLIQQDLSLKYKKNQINQRLISDFVSSIGELINLNSQSESQAIREFKRKFIDRYEDRAVPLLEVLDVESGIGFDTQGSSHTPFIHGIFPKYNAANRSLNLNNKVKLVNSIYEEVLVSGDFSYQLKEEDIEELGNTIEYNKIPPTFYSIGSLYRDDLLDQYKFYIGNCGGSSAINLITRFTHSNSNISENLQQVVNYEDESEEAILAEIVHLPESRVGNILQREKLRQFEIPILTNVNIDNENKIKLSDIYVAVRENKIYLFSKKLNKIIIPRLSTAHNYTLGISLYKFLSEIQNQVNFNIGWSWGNLNDRIFLPRIEYKNIILSRATWNISEKKGLEFLSMIKANQLLDFLKTVGIPDKVCLCQGDNELLLDFNSEISVSIFYSYLKKGSIILKECLHESFSLITKDEQGAIYNNEIIIPIKNMLYKSESKSDFFNEISVKRSFPFGSDWTYLKIYVGSKQGDKIISSKLKEIIRRSKDKIGKWFFIRYKDPHYHLRIRFYHPNISKIDFHKFILQINEEFEPLLQNNIITNIQYDTYHREIERYGEDTIEDIESIFHSDSDCIMEFLDLIEGDEGEKYRWLFALKGVDFLLSEFKFSLSEKIEMTRSIFESFFTEFNGDKSLTKQLNDKYRSDRYLVEQFFFCEAYPEEEQEAIDLLAKRSDEIRKILHNNSNFLKIKEKVPSILHMFLNRIFINNQRLHELVTYHYINKLYLTQKHKYGK